MTPWGKQESWRWIVPLAALLMACGGEMGDAEDETEQYASLAGSNLWDKNEIIPVCWENPQTAAGPAYLQMVRDAVTDSWEAHSGLNFTGWGKCERGDKGIHIRVTNSGKSYVPWLGRLRSSPLGSIVLNLDSHAWYRQKKIGPSSYIYGLAVHEFGHALGFAHEQNRSDTPKWCRDQYQGTKGSINIGDWDLNSVMNYCNPVNSGGGKLSKGDIFAAQTYYGETCYDIERGRRVNPRPCKGVGVCSWEGWFTVQPAVRCPFGYSMRWGYVRTTKVKCAKGGIVEKRRTLAWGPSCWQTR